MIPHGPHQETLLPTMQTSGIMDGRPPLPAHYRALLLTVRQALIMIVNAIGEVCGVGKVSRSTER